ncbi:uncharacterized protein BDV17DRAFT_285638 [Aspergillus undulatus]|uniref:uncharacterized protein n=1 Tax=Aspergillus undulatus TaxID=1810928 RepID=UPI003CCE0043
MPPKVALITGGASGIGLAVAKALSALPDWEIHILDINTERGEKTADTLTRTTFHYADVTKYSVLGEAFQTAFQVRQRLDFVFANAGLIERFNFYEANPVRTGDTVPPPPEPDLLSIVVDLKGAILTTYLTQHYFLASPGQGVGASIVMTAAADFGVVGFMRSVAQHFKARGVRANAICPGIVRTDLVDQNGWDAFPQHRFTEMEAVVGVVLQLVGVGEGDAAAAAAAAARGKDQDEGKGQVNGEGNAKGQDGPGLTDATGTHIPTERLFGQAVEISDSGVYFRAQHEFCDEGMREVMAATVLENQVGAILN